METMPEQTNSSQTRVDTRRVLIFIAFAYGIAWLVGLAVYFTGQLQTEAGAAPNAQTITAQLLVAALYMPAPAIAHVLTRLVTREGWKGVWLRPNFRKGWKYWVLAWVGPAVLTGVGIVVYFLVFPGQYDASLPMVQQTLDQAQAMTGQAVPFTPWMYVLIQIGTALLIAPLINSLFTFGEEFGWRAYLQPKLMVLGPRKAMLLMGVIWGVWHWPLTAQGHNYGLEYTGFPWLGFLTMTWFTFVLGVFLGWMTFRARSVWPAVIGHAAINGIAALGVYLVNQPPNLLIGPTSAGWVGGTGFAVVALLLFFSPKAWQNEPTGKPLLVEPAA